MSLSRSRFTLLATAAAIFFVGSVVSIPYAPISPDLALADKGGGGNGGGNGNNGGNGNGGGNGASGGGGNHGGGTGGTSASAGSGKGNQSTAVAGGKNVRAEMGALNSVNASLSAFSHAAPNSRVGRIAAYASANIAAQAAGQTAIGARTEFDAAEARVGVVAGELEALGLAVQAAAGDPAALALAEAAYIAKEQELIGALATRDGALVMLNEADLAAAAALEGMNSALLQAANKPVTDAAKAELDRILAAKGLLTVP